MIRTTTRTRARRWMATIAVASALVGLGGCRKDRKNIEVAQLNFTLKDADGHDVRLSDFKGKPILINFWATTCGPCRLETPELVDLAAKYKDRGLTILGISISDTPEDMRTFAKEFKIPYPLLVGDGREDVQDALGLGQGIPMTVFVTPAGMVYGRLEGLAMPAFLDKQINALF
jgi:cytochrome c biogenesis protein CcmG, thiol:disulfide interchange protein DsbE